MTKTVPYSLPPKFCSWPSLYHETGMNSQSNPERDGMEYTSLFSEVLGAITIGILILDMEKQEVFFRNSHAETIFDEAGADHGFNGVYSLLREEIEELLVGSSKRSAKKKIRFGSRLLGYTLYVPAVDNHFVAVFLQDITDQKRLEAIDEATEMMHNIGFLFSGIRHEIGNPINSIKMALTVLRKNVHRFPKEELDKYFERIFREVAKMEVLLKSLKTFNLFEKPRAAEVDLRAFFKEFLALFSVDARKKHIDLDVHLAEEARWVNIDVRALQHVIMNVFANAMDALSSRPDPKIVVRCQPGGEVVVLTISDTGCGMMEGIQGDIFKPFFTTKPQGTGLGLMLSRKLLAQMNCSMEISSKEGIGTTVTMLLPNASVDQPKVVGLAIDH
jgi:signal transduction histidine kinase